MCTVVNKYREVFDIYIGRGSKWGNPFPINIANGDTREVVIGKYKQWLWHEIDNNGSISIEDLKQLNNKRLGCFCKPKSCHGDIIQHAVKWAMSL